MPARQINREYVMTRTYEYRRQGLVVLAPVVAGNQTFHLVKSRHSERRGAI
jgi:hypothetical protein